jgi:hypothetical protein
LETSSAKVTRDFEATSDIGQPAISGNQRKMWSAFVLRPQPPKERGRGGTRAKKNAG